MLNFQKINLDLAKKLKSYLYLPNKIGCDYSIEVIYSWREELSTQVAFDKDECYIKSLYAHNNFCYYLPLVHGIDNLPKLNDYFLETQESKIFELCNLTYEEAQNIKNIYPHSRYFYERMWSDYIYLVDDFAEFKGNKYANKRHHVKKFQKLYPDVELVEAKEEDKSSIKDFLLEFDKEKILSSNEGRYEFKSSFHLVDVYDALGMRCFLLKEKGKIIGINILEFKNETIYDHVEKCLREYDGVYPYLVNKIAKMFQGKYKYINREDDSGDPGLRFSKEDYHPIFMYDKYLLMVTNNLDVLNKIPHLEINEDLYLDELNEENKEEYAKLNLDDERNKYWGYDYRSDLKEGEVADADYFYNSVREDFKNRSCFVFAIYYQNKLAGEVVAYNLKEDNSCEIGYRLFKEFEGKNIAYLSVNKVLVFLKNYVKIRYFSIKSFKENKKSLSLIERLKANKIGEDNTFFYFKIN